MPGPGTLEDLQFTNMYSILIIRMNKSYVDTDEAKSRPNHRSRDCTVGVDVLTKYDIDKCKQSCRIVCT